MKRQVQNGRIHSSDNGFHIKEIIKIFYQLIRKRQFFKWTRNFNWHFTKEESQMTNKHFKGHLTLIWTKEIQIIIKTSIGCHYTTHQQS